MTLGLPSGWPPTPIRSIECAQQSTRQQRHRRFVRTGGPGAIAGDDQHLANAGLTAQPAQALVEHGRPRDGASRDVRHRLHRLPPQTRRRHHHLGEVGAPDGRQIDPRSRRQVIADRREFEHLAWRGLDRETVHEGRDAAPLFGGISFQANQRQSRYVWLSP